MNFKELFSTLAGAAAIYVGIEKLITSTPSHFAAAVIVSGFIAVALLSRYKKL
jgi:hypothetical protein